MHAVPGIRSLCETKHLDISALVKCYNAGLLYGPA